MDSSEQQSPSPAPVSPTGQRHVLRRVLFAEMISMTGGQLTAVAMPWFVLQTTGSAARLGWVMGAQMAAVALFGVLGAPLAGRIGPRRTMLTGDLCRGPLVALVPLLQHVGWLPLPVLIMMLFAIGSFYAPYTASQQALLPSLVGDDEALLSTANAMLQGATRFSVLLGPVLAGVLITWLTIPAVLLLDAASYLASALLLQRSLPRSTVVTLRGDTHRLAHALRSLRADRLLGSWTIGQILSETAWQALFVMLPVLALRHFGGSSVRAGVLLGAFGGGALLGSLLVGRALRLLSATRLTVYGRIGQSVTFAALLLPLEFGDLVVVLAMAGVLNGLANAPMVAVRTARIPASSRATVLTVIASAGLTGGTLGLVGAGMVAQSASVRSVFVALLTLQTLAGAFFVVGAARGRHTPSPAQSPLPPAPYP